MHCFDALAATGPSCLRLDKMHCLKEKNFHQKENCFNSKGAQKLNNRKGEKDTTVQYWWYN